MHTTAEASKYIISEIQLVVGHLVRELLRTLTETVENSQLAGGMDVQCYVVRCNIV